MIQTVLFIFGSWGVAGGLVTDQLVYAVIFPALGTLTTGQILGVDRYLESHPIVERNSKLRYLLG
ncbi:hypothetical protein QA600_03910 [Natronococcus sp. A-GB1]|uniref:hypothetical protein n=1 Tax=Natronococcus sp. A-GB1 TaxID=3037648 RepID=UPI00241F70B4|nr:hypothetical protein [Natronococcus sp. A-GB1]MDG5758481.1 hypothetical protein [Natronococcus sp. A-GB1]